MLVVVLLASTLPAAAAQIRPSLIVKRSSLVCFDDLPAPP
jgi:hypothetical protein